MRRHALPIGAAVCLVLGVVLVLVGVDVLRWNRQLARDDALFRARPTRPHLWEVRETLPFRPARALLGVGDDIAYRRAARLFWLSRPGEDTYFRPQLGSLRARTQATLAQLSGTDPDPRRRSEEANLLGVMILSGPAPTDADAYRAILRQGITDFQDAVRLDGTNVDARRNLELALRTEKNLFDQFAGDNPSGNKGSGSSSGAGIIGSGY